MPKNNNNSHDRLSVNRFRTIDASTLEWPEYLDFIFAALMNDAIQILETSVNNDRAFNRAKFNMMRAFHDARTRLDETETDASADPVQ